MRRALMLVALVVSSGCTNWTTVHGGAAFGLGGSESVAGLGVRRGLGSQLHSTTSLLGVRAAGNAERLSAELEVGFMRPVRLGSEFSLVPAASLDVLRVEYADASWGAGAFGPAAGLELLWWFHQASRAYTRPPWFGCAGGPAQHCLERRVVRDVKRRGLGLRVEAEHNLRFSSDFPDHNSSAAWLLLGYSYASSLAEADSCRPER